MCIFLLLLLVYSVNRVFPVPSHSYLTPNLTYCFSLNCQISINKKCYRKGLDLYALFSTIKHMRYIFLQQAKLNCHSQQTNMGCKMLLFCVYVYISMNSLLPSYFKISNATIWYNLRSFDVCCQPRGEHSILRPICKVQS